MEREALKLALEELAVRFSEGWHEGIKIDASDIMLLSEAAQALALPDHIPDAGEMVAQPVQDEDGMYLVHHTAQQDATMQSLKDLKRSVCDEVGKAAFAQPAQEPVATKDWEGAEYWMPLAWALCAEECGEDACNDLIWDGGPIPEPWGERWLKYEDEAKRLIAMVQEHTAPTIAQPAQEPVEWLTGCPECGMDSGCDCDSGTLIDRAAQPAQEPVCPACKAEVLYECVACSSNNYPPQGAQKPDVVMHWASHTWTINNPPPKGSGDVNLYYAAQRPWVEPTGNEWFEWWRVSQVANETEAEIDFADFLIIAQAVVANLKDKNNG
jgi:hypothetical protein